MSDDFDLTPEGAAASEFYENRVAGFVDVGAKLILDPENWSLEQQWLMAISMVFQAMGIAAGVANAIDPALTMDTARDRVLATITDICEDEELWEAAD